MKDLLNLEEKVFIVTGGYGHLGTAMTLGLMAYGATVVVAGRSREKFDAQFSSSGKNVRFERCDIGSSEDLKNLFATVYAIFGRIDGVVNNAHYVQGNVAAGISDDDWAVTMEGVLGGVHKSMREIAPYLKNQRSGKIINIASMYGVVSPNPGIYEGERCSAFANPPHYGAAKAGIIQLTRYYAVNLGPFNVQVNCLTPGPFPKPAVQENEIFRERLERSNPLGRIGQPEDLVGPLVLLASKGSDFMTGQNILVDGGWTSW